MWRCAVDSAVQKAAGFDKRLLTAALLAVAAAVISLVPRINWLCSILSVGWFFTCGCALAAWLLDTGVIFQLSTPSEIDFKEKISTVQPSGSAADCAIEKRKFAYEEVEVPLVVNEAIDKFFETLLECHVHNWYRGKISEDEAFTDDLRWNIRYFIATITNRVVKVDLTRLILRKLLPAGAAHFDRFLRVRSQLSDVNSIHSGEPREEILPLNRKLFEQRTLDRCRSLLHKGMFSRETEVEYLRALALKATKELVMEGPRCSMTTSIFLQELLTFAVLLPLMDIIADPHIINRLLLLLFDPDPVHIYTDPETEKVALLNGFTHGIFCHTPDSLIQVRLSDIVRDPALRYNFMQFLKEAKRSLNYFQCLMAAEELQDKTLVICQQSARSQPVMPADLSHLQWEAWELYRNYFHETSAERVPFPEKVLADFKSAVEINANDLMATPKILQSALSQAFGFVYAALHPDVIQFGQSEVFLTYLAGGRDMVEVETDIRDSKSRDSLLTFAKLKTKLTNVFRASVEEGLLPSVKHSDSGEGLSTSYQQGSRSSRSNSFVNVLESGTDVLDDEDIFDFDQIAEGNGPLNGSVDKLSLNGGDMEIPDFNSPPARDISLWSVSIPRIEPRRDPATQRTMYVYVVESNPNDGVDEGGIQRKWLVDRRYHEFYALEAKLMEFHGNSLFDTLPPKKTLGTKSRAFVESCRHHFDEFLRSLSSNAALSGSELVHLFLTDENEFTTSFISNINPLKAIKNVPSKLIKERGQNLTTFLHSFILSTETFRKSPSYSSSLAANSRAAETRSVFSGSSSESGMSEDCIVSLSTTAKEKLLNGIYGNNVGLVWSEKNLVQNSSTKSFLERWTSGVLTNVCDILLYLLHRVYKVTGIFMCVAVTIRVLFRHLIDRVVERSLRKTLTEVLHERKVAELIELLRETLFVDETNSPTEGEKLERLVSTWSSMRVYLTSLVPPPVVRAVGEEQFELGSKLLLECLQNPRLNKQLSYVLLDLILVELFPELT